MASGSCEKPLFACAFNAGWDRPNNWDRTSLLPAFGGGGNVLFNYSVKMEFQCAPPVQREDNLTCRVVSRNNRALVPAHCCEIAGTERAQSDLFVHPQKRRDAALREAMRAH